MRDVGVVVDCTVLPINRPAGSLQFGTKFFSGKHHIYCVKAEVGVYPRTGTASTVSSIHTGSTHDFSIFKEHFPQFKAQLGGSKVLADSAYIGARADLDAYITKPVGTPQLASRRVIVERYFGRLKTLFAVFRHNWPFQVEKIADYFIVTCALTNFHILHNPLTGLDCEANQRFINERYLITTRKTEARRLVNDRYRAKLKNRLNPEASPTSRITVLLAEEAGVNFYFLPILFFITFYFFFFLFQ
ncbi:putative DDE superfamily endonuclease [Monocercomonoides exilis]|uniref:putative DDE superfamily endonuclease n=1 Tax=Monocercomonoides exilis TaxID=2049356 RepID=UPI00355955B4|nr:putative DDE superfamily endonuclease [Monocercomonoides exilis]|eukprot:MONOS_15966.1-p1 / transcript=MONOS_15966.1 / gene=MONOS_15966 / organism=Monocercomonoides_exilis_PA203 / gene_product=unspecified product / transcript_product=unspecified product / location=Mono_scaffold01431:4961-5695(+) / protein_length=244 / sequence_SO=supercontig / SO=protein_coding / is_pseudo=false